MREELLSRREAVVEREEADVRRARTAHLDAVRSWDVYMEAREKAMQKREKDAAVPKEVVLEETEPAADEDAVAATKLVSSVVVMSDSESEHSAQRPNW